MTSERAVRPVIAVGISCCLLLTLAAIAFALFTKPLAYVKPGMVGVVISPYAPHGYRDAILQPGLRFVLPGEGVVLYPTSPATLTISLGGSERPIPARDGRSVLFDATVVYSIDPANVLPLHISWQSRYERDLVEPLARGVARNVVAQYWPEQLVIGPPDEVERAIAAELRRRLLEENLILKSFTISNARYEVP